MCSGMLMPLAVAELEPALRQVVEHAQLLGQPQRVVEGQQVHQ